MSLLYSKYGDIEDEFYIFIINQIIYNLHTKINCYFREINYMNLTKEYLKRIYKIKESIVRIPKLNEYYKHYYFYFCRPTINHFKLSYLLCKHQEKKAEIFYKNNYKESKKKIDIKKEEKNNKSNTTSFSISSSDNTTDNKIIFDKQTKKMLEKSETELKNNNYYNTINLETSRSNLLLNNGLISKRTEGNKSFEKCIQALINSKYNNNQNKNKNKKSNFKNRKKKNIFINSNTNNSSSIKNTISKSQRNIQKFLKFKIYNNQCKIFNKIKQIKSCNNSASNRCRNKINKSKSNKNSLYSICNKAYSSSRSYKFLNTYKKIIKNIKEFGVNYPIISTNIDCKKIEKNKTPNCSTFNSLIKNDKKKTNIISNILYNSNPITTRNNIKKNFECQKENNKHVFKKYTKLSQYLNQIRLKENNIINKNSLHKKNCLSKEDEYKKIDINENINKNRKNILHSKNKTVDFNPFFRENNILSKNIIINEEFNSLLNNNSSEDFKDKYKGNNNSKNNKNNFVKIKKNVNNKRSINNPSSKRILNKISVTKNSSKEKNIKKILTVTIFSPNFTKHRKNNKSLYNNYINTNREFLIKSNIMKKINISTNKKEKRNNKTNLNSYFSSSITPRISPINKLFNSFIYFKRNINHNYSINNSKNNIYIRKSINKDNKKIIQKKENNKLINSCNFNNEGKELYRNIIIPFGNTNNNSNLSNNKFNENKNNSIKTILKNIMLIYNYFEILIIY